MPGGCWFFFAKRDERLEVKGQGGSTGFVKGCSKAKIYCGDGKNKKTKQNRNREDKRPFETTKEEREKRDVHII